MLKFDNLSTDSFFKKYIYDQKATSSNYYCLYLDGNFYKTLEDIVQLTQMSLLLKKPTDTMIFLISSLKILNREFLEK